MAIQARNQIVPRSDGNGVTEQKKKPSEIFLSKGTLNLLQSSFGDMATARRVATTLLSVYQRTPKLQECKPETIIAAALEGEGSKNLSLSNGDYAIVPYGDKATFQIQVNGIKRLCLRSLAYADINAFDVREGEFKGRDPVTRRPIFQWIDDEDEREQLPIVGYYAFYKLNEKYNGFTQAIYWSHDKILRHADRYSKAFSLEKYHKLLSGEMSEKEANWLRNGSPWYGDPTDEGHIKMCKKTVLKQLLGDGLAPKEIADIVSEDNETERTGEAVKYDNELFGKPEVTPAAETADEAAQEPREAAQSVEAPPEVSTPSPAKKRGRPAKAVDESAVVDVPYEPVDEVPPMDEDDHDSFFFGGR